MSPARFITLLSFVIFAAACDPQLGGPEPLQSDAFAQVEAPRMSPIDAINDLSKESYAQARSRLLSKHGPILMVGFDGLRLKYAGATYVTGENDEPRRVTPSLHRIKSVSHGIALGIFSALNDCEATKWSDKRPELENLRAPMITARDQNTPDDFTAEQAAREDRLLYAGSEFLTKVLNKGACPTPEELQTFINTQKDDLAAATRDTTRMYLDHLHKETNELLAKLPADQVNNTTVVIIGSQLPRSQNAATQYFARRFGEKGESPKIIYAEMIFGTEGPLGLLGTHRLDRLIAKAFFNDEWRMHRDLLADDATVYLDKLFAR